MEDYLLLRINQLAKKSRTEGLTDEEKKEQAELRQKYLARFRASFTAQLNNTYVVDEKGNETPLSEYQKKKK